MIKRIHIKGYQSLVDTEIELGRFTVITGESDSGKSAFIRAIDGWARNQAGSDFITHGKSSTTVSVEMDSGDSIIWKKPSNSYLLNGKEFSKAGRECPPEVKQVTGFIDVAFDSDYSDLLNIANQFDPPFLVTLSGSRIAKVIGKVSGIEFLYNAQRLANKEIVGTRSKIGALESLLESLKLQLESFSGLEGLRAGMDMAQERMDKAVALLDKASTVATVLDLISDAERLIERAEEQIKSIPDAAKIDFGLIADRLGQAQEILNTLSSIETLDNRAISISQALTEVKEREQEASADLQEFWDSLKICPLCERELDHAHA